MIFRSILFVPADRPERFDKAMASEADAVILDLEDSVAAAKKDEARAAIKEYLSEPKQKPVAIRVNPLNSTFIDKDIAMIEAIHCDALVLPKAEGKRDILELVNRLKKDAPPILPVATETPAAIFELGSYKSVGSYLAGLTWGAEDLPAAIGASTSRNHDGSYTSPYELVRSLSLFAAHAADIPAIETVYPNIKDEEGLAEYAARGRRDGFVGMMAIHPKQCAIINAAFTPTKEEILKARKIVDAFKENPNAGALQVDGTMVDAPHLKQAKKILETKS